MADGVPAPLLTETQKAFPVSPEGWPAPSSAGGQQLEVLIGWAAHDWAGRPWADEWHPITFLKRSKPGEGEGLYERARAMEAAKYAVGGGVAPEGAAGTRCSPRLVEMQGEMG